MIIELPMIESVFKFYQMSDFSSKTLFKLKMFFKNIMKWTLNHKDT